MAMVAHSLVSKLIVTLFEMAKEELARQFGLVDDVKKLQGTLEDLQCYLQDAEKKRIEDASMNRWLNQIMDVMYDIEDLLEEYFALKVDDSESSSSGGDESSSSSTKVSCNFPILYCFTMVASNHRIDVQIQKLNKKLEDEIMKQIPRLEIMRSFATSGPVANQITQNQLTAHITPSGLIRSDIVGNTIHDDAKRLVESLTKQDGFDNPLVFAIVGMGGIGKTTLAKLAFDDHVIKNSFEVKSWIVVSQNYDEIDILRSIITSAGGDDEHCHNLNLLSEKVKNIVEGKRLLMVLDDVWETERVWKGVLRSLLKSGAAEGSRVLVTTRNKEVADRMMAIHSHEVQPLSLEDGWSLLCKSAFPAWEQQKAKMDANLKDIGLELVKKCDGLPLAIDVIGGMLSAESRTREAWELVLKSSVWEVNGLPKDIHSALYLSYQHLPTNIKHCFLYCSLFPNDSFVSVRSAKHLWIEEGLIKDETGISSHDVAESYFRMLVQRNLLKINLVANSFTMHNLVCSLSRFLKQNESLVATDEKNNLNCSGRTMKLRHLSFIGRGNKTMNSLPKSLQDQVSLRTLLIFDKSICKIDYDLFNHLRHLRILWLQGTEVRKLPKSFGALKQLRYLNLSGTLIRKLPKTIQNLKSLRLLNVSECVNLCKLPSCLMKLHRLGSLYLYDSPLDYLPPGLGRLKELQFLDFVIPLEDITQESSNLKELGMLTELRRIGLYKLERLLDKSQANSAALKDKQHLQKLNLCYSKSDSNEVSMNCAQVNEVNNIMEEIFEELCPPPQLRDLLILNYSGSKLPSWLGHGQYKSLFCLDFVGCRNCKQLDGIGLLASLEILAIIGASSIKSIGPEFYTGNSRSNLEKGALEPAYQNVVFLPRIKLLTFQEMDGWEEWSGLGKAIPAMPHLESLQIFNCPKLKSFPEELLYHARASLREIRICFTGELLLKVVDDLPCLKILELANIPNLKRISRLPALQELYIWDCPGIKSVELTHHLQTIFWQDFNTDRLPGWFCTDGNGDGNKLNATYLKISCKEELMKKLCYNKANEDHELPKRQYVIQPLIAPVDYQMYSSVSDCLYPSDSEDNNKLNATDLEISCQEELWNKICYNKESDIAAYMNCSVNTMPSAAIFERRIDGNKLIATYPKIRRKEELVKKICDNKENEDHEWSKIQHFDDVAIWDKDGYFRFAYTKNTNSFTIHPGKAKRKTSSVE